MCLYQNNATLCDLIKFLFMYHLGNTYMYLLSNKFIKGMNLYISVSPGPT